MTVSRCPDVDIRAELLILWQMFPGRLSIEGKHRIVQGLGDGNNTVSGCFRYAYPAIPSHNQGGGQRILTAALIFLPIRDYGCEAALRTDCAEQLRILFLIQSPCREIHVQHVGRQPTQRR